MKFELSATEIRGAYLDPNPDPFSGLYGLEALWSSATTTAASEKQS